MSNEGVVVLAGEGEGKGGGVVGSLDKTGCSGVLGSTKQTSYLPLLSSPPPFFAFCPRLTLHTLPSSPSQNVAPLMTNGAGVAFPSETQFTVSVHCHQLLHWSQTIRALRLQGVEDPQKFHYISCQLDLPYAVR